MPRCLPDSSVMVAALCAWHEHHAAAVAELDQRLGTGTQLVAAGPAMVETYAVLTRLRAPYRQSASDAQALTARSFLDGTELVALEGAPYRDLLDRALVLGVIGGQVYDLVIAECARQAGVDALLTFNARHFRRLADRAIDIVIPGEETR
jgi:predicted nucleic acid-binding protein